MFDWGRAFWGAIPCQCDVPRTYVWCLRKTTPIVHSNVHTPAAETILRGIVQYMVDASHENRSVTWGKTVECRIGHKHRITVTLSGAPGGVPCLWYNSGATRIFNGERHHREIQQKISTGNHDREIQQGDSTGAKRDTPQRGTTGKNITA